MLPFSGSWLESLFSADELEEWNRLWWEEIDFDTVAVRAESPPEKYCNEFSLSSYSNELYVVMKYPYPDLQK